MFNLYFTNKKGFCSMYFIYLCNKLKHFSIICQVWNCHKCYCVFHLNCIQRWSKDSIYQKKQIQESPIQVHQITLTWGCPKCRHGYQLEDIPEKYLCFCEKTVDPKLQPFLVPHSCGEICGKDLVPSCGHKCLLLCHPGMF
jgi:NF-X1-type zinc finger protein NFXL1